MPRIRWAVRCHARRTNGKPCTAWAIRGGQVCQFHGGSSPKARHAAVVRLVEMACQREFEQAQKRWRRQLTAFHVKRLLTASRLLGKPVEEIDQWDIILCHVEHGVPPLEHEAPQLKDVPRDRRVTRYLLGLGR